MRFLPFILVLLMSSLAYGVGSLSYSGRLVNANGSPVSGRVNLSFDLAYSNNVDVILCTQSLNSVELSNGLFHVMLHFPTCNLPELMSNIPTGNTVSIRVVDITNGDKKYPFQSIHSVPFSFVSQTSKQLAQMGATPGQVLSWEDGVWKPKTLNTEISNGSITDEMLQGNIPRGKIAAGTANEIVVNDASGNLSSVNIVPLSMGGTGATDAASARVSIGAMAISDVPLCNLPHQKLQMKLGPVYWSCENDLAEDDSKLPLIGGTLTGPLILSGNPDSDFEAATKKYVDSAVNAIDLTSVEDDLQSVTDRGASTTTFSKFDGGAGFSHVGIGTDTPVGVLDIHSTTSGVLIPRMNTLQRDVVAMPTGMIIYNLDTNKINYHNGDTWKELGISDSGVQKITVGAGLTPTGDITSTGSIAVDVGTTTGKIIQVDADNKLPVIDGSQLTNLNPINLGSVVPITRGGTGLTSFDVNRVYISNGTGAFVPFSCGMAQIFGFNGSGAPTCLNFDTVNSAEVKQGGNIFGTAMVIGTNDENSMSFETNNTNKMTILPNGNVGIGTEIPETQVVIKNANGDRDTVFILRSDTSPNLDFYSNYNGDDDVQTGSFAYGVRPTQDSWQIWEKGLNTEWENLMTVLPSGNVGVGVLSPSSKLTVDGTIESLSGGVKFPDGTVLTSANGMNAAGSAVAWVAFSGATGAIQSSFNISSVTRTAVGRYNVTFSSSLSDSNYAVVFGGSNTGNGDGVEAAVDNLAGGRTASSVKIVTAHATAGSYQDYPQVFMAVFQGNGTAPIANGQWTQAGDNVYRTAGNVGIGTSNPISKMTLVNGDITIDSDGDNNYAGIGEMNGGLVLSGKTISNAQYDLYIADSGRVGIGTTTPTHGLHLSAATTASNSVMRITSTNTKDAHIRYDFPTDSTKYWVAGSDFDMGNAYLVWNSTTPSDIPFYINSASNYVGIGTYSPSYRLHVAGTAAGTSWSNLSDLRFKRDIKPLDNSLERILQLNGVTYNWRQEDFPERNFEEDRDLGLIAQNVEKVFPEAVTEDQEGYKGVKYSNLIAAVIEAIKELFYTKAEKAEVEELRKENAELKAYLCAKDPEAPMCK